MEKLFGLGMERKDIRIIRKLLGVEDMKDCIDVGALDIQNSITLEDEDMFEYH